MNGARIAGRSRAAVDVDIEVVQETGSTNADLLARAGALRRPLLLAAVHQSAGRGRAGRSWLSQAGGSLTFSLAWRFDGGITRLAGLPLAVGVALADALGELGVPSQLKWPNDIERDGAKLAGILIETAAVPGATWAVIGIGMNLSLPDQLEERIGRPVANAAWLAQMDRDLLMAALLDSLWTNLREFEREGFGAFSERWNQRHAYQGKHVAITDGGVLLRQGIACGVDHGGRLLLDCGSERVAIVAGDVSLRALES